MKEINITNMINEKLYSLEGEEEYNIIGSLDKLYIASFFIIRNSHDKVLLSIDYNNIASIGLNKELSKSTATEFNIDEFNIPKNITADDYNIELIGVFKDNNTLIEVNSLNPSYNITRKYHANKYVSLTELKEYSHLLNPLSLKILNVLLEGGIK